MTAPRKRVNSRAKGKRGELQLAKALTDLGHPARRGQQRKGGEDSPDVICESLPGVHFECKLTATCQFHSPAQLAEWDAQARRDAGARLGVVAHRWNGARNWWARVLLPGRLAIWVPLADFVEEAEGWLADHARLVTSSPVEAPRPDFEGTRTPEPVLVAPVSRKGKP